MPGTRKNVSVPVAQWIARWTSNPKVPGSNPGRDANVFGSLSFFISFYVDFM